MILPLLFSAIVAGISAGASVAAFFGISATAGFLIAATAGGLAANYLRNKIPKPGANNPQNTDYRTSTPAAVAPARHIYGRARVGGIPAFVEEYQISPTRDRQRQIYLISEGVIDEIESVWANGLELPSLTFNGGSTDFSSGQSQYSTGYYDTINALINTWQTRKDNVRAQLTDPDNPPRGVDTLLQHIQGELDNATDRKEGQSWLDQRSGSWHQNLAVAYARGTNENNRGSWGARIEGGRLTSAHDFNGIGLALVTLTQPFGEEGKFYNSPPRLEFLVKGKRLTWPGNDIPTWTENAAAVYYDWLVNIQGIDPDDIDRDSFDAAYAVCNEQVIIPLVARGDEDEDKPFHANDILEAAFGTDTSTWPNTTIQDTLLEVWNERYAGAVNAEIRYSINGVVDTSLDPQEVERQFNTCWAGHIVERGGKIYFEPGKEKAASLTIGEDDLIADVHPTWQVEPPLSEKMTSVTCDLTQSKLHDWLDYSTPKVLLDADGEDDFPQDLGRWSYVAYPSTATRLLNIFLRRANGGKAATMTITRGTNWAHYGIAPTDRVLLDMPNEGEDGGKFFVESASPNLEGNVELSLTQEAPNTYDDIVTVPLELSVGSKFSLGVAAAHSTPQSLVFELIQYTTWSLGGNGTGHQWVVGTYANGEVFTENASGLVIRTRQVGSQNWSLRSNNVFWAVINNLDGQPPTNSISFEVQGRWDRNGIISDWGATATYTATIPT